MFSMVIGITKYYHNDVILFRNKYYGKDINFTKTLVSSNNNESTAWIVGKWVPNEEDYAEGEIITFKADGSFSFGDDCTTKGTYTIKENAVYLNGKTACPEIDLNNNVYYDEVDYSETITMQNNRLKGYSKL
jgi:hypothetical protein